MRHNAPLRAWHSLALLGLIAGCSTTPRDRTDDFEKAPTLNVPTTAPIRSVSSFSDSLSCMDRMLRDYRVQPVLIASKNIPDATGKVNVAFKEMVITGLSAMSRTSGAFRYVDYEVDAVKQDTVQNLTGILLNAGQMRLQRPAMYVSGALTYMDQNISIQRMGGGISASRWDLGASNDVMSSALGLDLHLGDFNSRTLLPGVDSSNTIVVGNVAYGGEGGGRIRKTGIQFNFGAEVSQGTGPAVRTLIDLGLIELVGKWAHVPYWQCLALDQTHPEYQAQMRDWWQQMSGAERMQLFQIGLKSSGYFDGANDGKPSAALRTAIQRYQADQNVVVTGNLNFETYERLTRDYVHFDGAGKFIRVGWGLDGKRAAEAKGAAAQVAMSAKDMAALKPRRGRVAIDAAKSPLPELKVHLSQADGHYAVGETMSFSLVLDRQSYVYCYYQDARSRVTQVYPNPMQRAQPLRGNTAVQVPDVNNPQSFSISLDEPGPEELLCVAAERDAWAQLPASLRGPALQPMAGVDTVYQVLTAFKQAVPDGRFSVNRAQWVIGGP